MKRLRLQLFISLFFILWIANTVVCHAIGHDFIEVAKARRVEPAAAQVEDRQLAHGQGLIFLNLPLFVGLGFIVRQDAPGTGALYWTLLVAGSAILPFIVTLCAFLMVHAPTRPGAYPGVDLEDDPVEKDESDD